MGIARRMWVTVRVFGRARRNRLDLLRWLIRRPFLLGAVTGYEVALLASGRVERRH
jgi:hypothetical protein